MRGGGCGGDLYKMIKKKLNITPVEDDPLVFRVAYVMGGNDQS